MVFACLLAVAAHGAGLGGDFVHDDANGVLGAALQRGDWWGAAFGSVHIPSSGRPLPCLTFATGALFGSSALAHHATNLLLHVVNVALLFCVVRRCAAPWNGAATRFAFVVAAAFGVHPLGVDAVGYVSQRSTLMMATCFLLALYGTLRAAAGHTGRWRTLVVAAVFAGMACKEEFVGAPILVAWFDRTFVGTRWRGPYWRHLACLAASWSVLAACVVAAPPNRTVGYDAIERVTAIEWLQTQAPVVVRYLGSVVWPSDLRTVYDLPIVRTFGAAVLPGLVVVTLLAATVVALRRWPRIGWLGAVVFVFLAPTSTVLPIVTEIAADRRMYVPMAAVLVLVVLAIERVGVVVPGSLRPRLAAAAFVVSIVGLATVTVVHGRAFANELAVWTDAAAKSDGTARGLLAGNLQGNLAHVLRVAGRFDEAHEACDRALACDPLSANTRVTCAVSLNERGRRDEALVQLRRALQTNPNLAFATYTLANVLSSGPASAAELAEAATLMQSLLQRDPNNASYHHGNGVIALRRGDLAAAEGSLQRACGLAPGYPPPLRDLVALYRGKNRHAEAVPLLVRLLQSTPNDVDARLQLAQSYFATGSRTDALREVTAVLGARPNDGAATALLQQLQPR